MADKFDDIEGLKEFVNFTKFLSEDLKTSYELLLAEDSQFHRRTFIRTFFSYIEGNIFEMKQWALSTAKLFVQNAIFSNAEISIIEERAYELNERGEVISIKAKLQLPKNLRFAFKAFAKANNLTFELPVNSSGWEAFLKTIKVRDRLMHPKQIADLSVTDEELKIAQLAFDWFMKNENKLRELAINSLGQRNHARTTWLNKINHILDTEGEEGLRKALDAGEFEKWGTM